MNGINVNELSKIIIRQCEPLVDEFFENIVVPLTKSRFEAIDDQPHAWIEQLKADYKAKIFSDEDDVYLDDSYDYGSGSAAEMHLNVVTEGMGSEGPTGIRLHRKPGQDTWGDQTATAKRPSPATDSRDMAYSWNHAGEDIFKDHENEIRRLFNSEYAGMINNKINEIVADYVNDYIFGDIW